jgi:endonuclease III
MLRPMRTLADGRRPSPAQRARAARLAARLADLYPDVRTALDWDSTWQLLVATVCSAQTTDENVNRAMPALFARFPHPEDLAVADPAEVERLIYSTGYYRQKTRSIIALAASVVDDHDGVVPDDMDALIALPGVGRKTASVVLAEAWGRPEIAVDTHVKRVANRLGLTIEQDPVRVERDLKAQVPRSQWARLSMRMIQFGRDTCDARRPACGSCPLRRACPWPDKP